MLNWTEINVSDKPEALAEMSFDCILLLLKEDPSAPFESQIIRSLDWKMLGQVTRAAGGLKQHTIFVPTMNKIPSRYIALQKDTEPLDQFLENCMGLHLKTVALINERGHSKASETSLLKLKGTAGALYPQSVTHLSETLREPL